jgi:hypothetical protein
MNKLANLFTKGFSTSIPQRTSHEHHTSTQTYDTIISSPSPPRFNINQIQPSMTADNLNLTFREQV